MFAGAECVGTENSLVMSQRQVEPRRQGSASPGADELARLLLIAIVVA